MLNLLASLIGLAITGFGLTIFISPKFVQKVLAFFQEGKRLYWAGVFRCLVGILLLFVAPKSVVPVATVAVGTLFLLSGIIIFACDLDKLKSFLVHYSEMPVLVTRLLGLVAASFGILIFSIV